MDDDWESAAEKEVVIRPKIANMNKWDGEDDDEDVKESWEDEEEKKDEEKSETKTVPAKPKPNKALKAKLAEEERLAEETEERRLANMTPEEKLAEKLRLQKIQQEADLKSALETFGVTNVGDNIITLNPETKEDFKEFATTLSWKITQYKESPHYEQLVEDLVRSICANMTAADIKKVKISVENLHSEKLKIEKQTKKPVGKGKARATIRTENDDIETYRTYGNDFGGDEYDDFM